MKRIVLFCLVCVIAVPAVAQDVSAQGQSYGSLPPPAYSNYCIGSFDADIFIYSGYESKQAEYGFTTSCPAVLDSVPGFVEEERIYPRCSANSIYHIIRKNSTENNNK